MTLNLIIIKEMSADLTAHKIWNLSLRNDNGEHSFKVLMIDPDFKSGSTISGYH